MTLTIGYWKNWSSCSGGNQALVLDQTLLKLANVGTSETLGKLVLNPQTLGTKTSCQYAVDILNKTAITGTRMAGDPLFNLASQLLGADLNVAGAGQCPASAAAINNAYAPAFGMIMAVTTPAGSSQRDHARLAIIID